MKKNGNMISQQLFEVNILVVPVNIEVFLNGN